MAIVGNVSRPFSRLTVFHQGALGDFLLACPVFEALARLTTSGRILLWTRRQHAELIENEPFFEGFFPHDDLSVLPFFDENLWKKAPIPSPCADADLVILLGKRSLNLVAERLNQRLSEHGKRCVWCPSFPEPGVETPVPVFIANHLESVLGVPIQIKPFKLNITEQRLEQAREILADAGNPVLIHPGSGGVRKIWPLANWMGLIEWMKTSFPRQSLAVVTGPADSSVEPLAKWAAEHHGAIRIHNVSLPVLSAVLSLGRLYIGNDSGVSHLAAACGVPAIVIFGPTSPSVWAPWRPDVVVLKKSWQEENILSIPDPSTITAYFPDPETRNLISSLMVD